MWRKLRIHWSCRARSNASNYTRIKSKRRELREIGRGGEPRETADCEKQSEGFEGAGVGG